MSRYEKEVTESKRFEFGENWGNFLQVLDNERILQAEQSLKNMLEIENLEGKRFLDIGSGSGLFSLAARRLGARVYSFDYDPNSVACTKELKRRYFSDDHNWIVEEGDVLNKKYLSELGEFDIVYSWGVLHHTGDMWKALENICTNVADEGKLYIAIYNDQGRKSKYWKTIKELYNKSPNFIKLWIVSLCLFRLWAPTIIRDLASGKPMYSWRNYSKKRGMSPWYDVVDWVGGYPFEVAKPEEIFEFYKKSGFGLAKLVTCGGGLGCNEYVFIKKDLN
ncbi:class I SAM-dependent methyltransferase [Effusibacillus lacus]|uniref:SAM-dependent methyltransferase n=1 Tax=Effusibacillus lacus TaxID=1348429 RepID=A0A292YT24_9BACL|nr:class I SAM-dependent methyltransferase [Effusibacillus lacus]TCS73725.1 2-polyprenyl-6-hydroxyphenyl methylase/3-demethylubiquinone-9 3-methyltransferase [Effusibacillus lacus]GAX92061.1 SAM-dependent methyltransferase [Effusibacillus lacus]